MKLAEVIGDAAGVVETAVADVAMSLEGREVGVIDFVTRSIARVRGLPSAQSEELLRFEGGLHGLVFNADPGELGIVLLGDGDELATGMEARRTGRVLDVPVGDGLLGRVVDALGQPLDGAGPVPATERLPVERPAPAIMDRSAVSVPLQTGLKAVDALIPIGRGQRELILGDRQTGKTAVALDTILNQHDKDVLCVYCAIGQRGSAVAKFVQALREHDALRYTVVMVASGEDAPGLQYLAPYAAAAMGEHFMEQGRDVLVVYDDLTRHARSYRELSLLLRRPPGREAFPGDIFYIHSRLLERSTQLSKERGGGSLTALPIIETEAQDVSAYIPTNLISITDGQIYLSPELFRRGNLPAVDVGQSVSRVGGKTQLDAYRAVAGPLRLSYSQFSELERFARFGTRLDPETRKTLERGYRVRELLKQPQYAPLPAAEQVAVLLGLVEGVFDAVPLDRVARAEERVREAVRKEQEERCRRIAAGEKLSDEDREAFVETARKAVQPEVPEADPADAADKGAEEEAREQPKPGGKGAREGSREAQASEPKPPKASPVKLDAAAADESG